MRNFFSPNNRPLHGGLADVQPAYRLHTTHPEQFVYILPFRLMLPQNDPMSAELIVIRLRHRRNLARNGFKWKWVGRSAQA
jgi:hypothetical protein